VHGTWFRVALVLFAGSQLHDMFWPSAYSPVLTSSSVLELALAAVVAAAGVVELRRVANERAALLANERDSSRRLMDLSVMKSDFTAMVAHELGGPLSAIRRNADWMAMGGLQRDASERALSTIQTEAKLLSQLVVDVQAIARDESLEFVVDLRPCRLGPLLAGAADYARTLPGRHPLRVSRRSESVLADPARIAQVLHNLLNNAAKYSADGTPIELRATRLDSRVRIEVIDHGEGIPPEDLNRIFEKFGHGRNDRRHPRAGAGLGLYVARRIVTAHGTSLSVTSHPGEGTTFGFELRIAP
jgi:signal transduction histidine kinase